MAGRDLSRLRITRPHDGGTSGDGQWEDPDGLAVDSFARTQLGSGEPEPQAAGHPAVCKVVPAIVDSSKRGIPERFGFPGKSDENIRCQVGQGNHIDHRDRQGRQEVQEAVAKGKSQIRSKRGERHFLLAQTMNPELKETMSSTSSTAARCYAGRVVTEKAFERDIASFDACGNPLRLKHSSPDKCPNSPNTCRGSSFRFTADSPDTFSFLDILDRCLQVNMQAHIGLRDFILLSCVPATRTAQFGTQSSKDLMPCPPPLWRWTGSQRPSPKQRRKIRFLKLVNRIVQQIICTLNWEALGHVVKPPVAACAGSCISPDQHLMIERIESMVLRFATAGCFQASMLGRSADKLERLLAACQELPGVTQDVDLLDVVNSVRQGLDPYGSNTSSKTPNNQEAFCQDDQSVREVTSTDESVVANPDSKIHLDSSTCKPVVADRIKWEHSPQFDPRPFLTDPVVKAAFNNPEHLRLPAERWIKQPCGRVHCSRKEVIKLARKWDEKGALKIFPCSVSTMMKQ